MSEIKWKAHSWIIFVCIHSRQGLSLCLSGSSSCTSRLIHFWQLSPGSSPLFDTPIPPLLLLRVLSACGALCQDVKNIPPTTASPPRSYYPVTVRPYVPQEWHTDAWHMSLCAVSLGQDARSCLFIPRSLLGKFFFSHTMLAICVILSCDWGKSGWWAAGSVFIFSFLCVCGGCKGVCNCTLDLWYMHNGYCYGKTSPIDCFGNKYAQPFWLLNLSGI